MMTFSITLESTLRHGLKVVSVVADTATEAMAKARQCNPSYVVQSCQLMEAHG